MKVNNFRELTKLLKLCQAHGVVAVEIEGMKMSILPKTKTAPKQAAVDLDAFVEEHIPVPQYNGQALPEEPVVEAVDTPGSLTEDQLLNWSASSVEEVVN
jgi:hypothetical protein